jgi:hypothetical protein
MRYILAFLIILMPACASDRWLTAEEDAAFRAQCENKDCKIVPGVLWEQIKAVLERAMGTPI